MTFLQIHDVFFIDKSMCFFSFAPVNGDATDHGLVGRLLLARGSQDWQMGNLVSDMYRVVTGDRLWIDSTLRLHRMSWGV